MIVTRTVPIAGTSFHEGARDRLARMRAGASLRLEREPNNPADRNAVAVYDRFNNLLGYLPRQIAVDFAPPMDAGAVVKAKKADKTWFAMDLAWEEPDADDPCA